MLSTNVKRLAEDMNALFHKALKDDVINEPDVLELLSIISDGFCKHCGNTSLPCHCMNDD